MYFFQHSHSLDWSFWVHFRKKTNFTVVSNTIFCCWFVCFLDMFFIEYIMLYTVGCELVATRGVTSFSWSKYVFCFFKLKNMTEFLSLNSFLSVSVEIWAIFSSATKSGQWFYISANSVAFFPKFPTISFKVCTKWS